MAAHDSHETVSDLTVVKELFGLVLDADEAEASSSSSDERAVIDEARAAMNAAEPAVRNAVERLLAAHRRAAGVLLEEKPGKATGQEHAREEIAGGFIKPQISGYDVGDELGRGGFGVVYRAEQLQPVQRPVAVKILRTELASPNIIARFRAESRVLAKMNHAGIARVLDAGLDSLNRPFVAMELVEGKPLLRYCEQHQLNLRERLGVMVDVCEAVHHAHQRAVIHRDLKPANILVERVDGKHRPRVIDFGIAKIVEEDGDETRTQEGAKLGTPRYMSPEQAAGTDVIDVRTDVYALGVLVCEVLTNQVPRDAAGTSDSGGGKPKTRATRPSQLAASGDAVMALRSRELKGDLDRIVLKAVSLEPDERYASAAALADDLQRYLDGRPVLATPQGVWYLTRKFVARRQLVSAAIGLSALSMVGGTAAAMYGLARANESRIEAELQQGRAEHEATIATEINAFWIDIIQRSSPQEARRPDLQVREALDLAAPRLDEHIDDPGVRRRLHVTFSDAYQALGLAEPQLHHAKLAWQLLDAEDAPAMERVQASLTLGSALMDAHELDEARSVLHAALEMCESSADALLHRQQPLLMQSLARVETRDGAFAQAESMYLDALQRAQDILGPEHETTTLIEQQLAMVLVTLGRAQEAIDLLEPILQRHRATVGANHPDAINALSTLANARQVLGHFEQAERDYAAVLELSIPVLGEDHSYILVLRNNLASLLREMRRFEEAEAVFRVVRAAHLRTSGLDHPNTLRATSNLATSLVDQKKYEEAEPFLVEAVQGRSSVLGPEHPDTINVKHVLASVYANTDRLEEAGDLYRVLLEQLREAVPAGHVRLAPLLRSYGGVLQRNGRIKQALELFIESHDILLNVAGPEHPQTIRAVQFICDALALLDDASGFDAWREHCATTEATD